MRRTETLGENNVKTASLPNLKNGHQFSQDDYWVSWGDSMTSSCVWFLSLGSQF